MTWRRNVAHIAAVAAGTAVMTVTVLAPSALWATDPETPAAENQKPVVQIGEVRVSATLQNELSADRTLPEGPAKLAFQVTATNPTQQTQVIDSRLVLSQSSPRDQWARREILPQTTWQQPLKITLAPGETRTVPIAVETNLLAGSSYQLRVDDAPSDSQPLAQTLAQPVSISELKPLRIALLTFSVHAPAPALPQN